MRPRPVILAAAAGAAAAAAVLAAGGSAQAPGTRTLTFRETDRGSTFGIVDNPPRSRRTRQGSPTRVSAGDTVAISQRLVQGSGPATGTIHVSCTATTGRAQRFDRAVFVCHATTTLPDGTIALEAALRFGDQGVTAAVTGGTGAYEGARGTFTSAGDPSVDTFRLLP
jgi:hypothetical protein